MSDHRWRRDPMGRPYDPYRGFDERGRTGGGHIPDESGYDRSTDRRGAADPGYRPDEHRRRDQSTDQYRSHDRGHLGEWEWQRARRGEVEGDYGRGYGNRENGPYHRDDHYGGQQDYRGGYVSREDVNRRMGNEDRQGRPPFSRAADEASSWFGDNDAERRRRMDRYDDDQEEWGQRRRDRDRGWTSW